MNDESEPINPFEIETVADALRNYKERDFLVQNLIHEDTVNLIVGQPKSGKSFVMLFLSKALSEGSKFANMYTCKKSKVLIIDEDDGRHTVLSRCKSIGIVKNDNILLMVGKGFQIDNDVDFKRLRDTIAKEDINVLVLDSFLKIHRKEENNASEMRDVTQRLRAIANLGVTVFVIHHAGKSFNGIKNTARGSQEITAGMDTVYSIGNKKGLIILSSSMLRDLKESDDIISLELVEKGKLMELKCVNKTSEPRDRKDDAIRIEIVEALKKLNKPSSIKDVVTALLNNHKESMIRRAMNRLVACGEVKKESTTHNKSLFTIG